MEEHRRVMRELFEEIGNATVRFWMCPDRTHHDPRDANGRPLPIVEWDKDGVAHCLYPGCTNTSASK